MKSLREELEVLRGEPIEVLTGDPMDIPCVETSDAEKLCKHPVASVHMITYNHEPYIRQAIEGVMMQKTDFEFELVIGEDCSQDKTREICFEYQKKHPDKIRLLWWHENVSRLGGNGRRTRAHCRGEFIATCEGDDYWIDPLKLQKQVDVMRKHPNVGFCFCGARIYTEKDQQDRIWNDEDSWTPGVISSREFLLKNLFGRFPAERGWKSSTFIMTATVMFRSSVFKRISEEFDIFSWRLHIGDSTLWLGLASVADAYYCPDVVAVYNQRLSGSSMATPAPVILDTIVVKLYYCRRSLRINASQIPGQFFCFIAEGLLWWRMVGMRYREQLVVWGRLLRSELGRALFLRKSFLGVFFFATTVGVHAWWRVWMFRYYAYIVDVRMPNRWVRDAYEAIGKPIDIKSCQRDGRLSGIVRYIRRKIGI